MKKDNIKKFSSYKRGLFVHFGIYSQVGKAEWYLDDEKVPILQYKKLANTFSLPTNWTNDIIECAKLYGAKYIVLTTRHHDGFSLYNTKGLSDFDIMHTPTKRDIIKEFVDACNKNDIKPFFYHTLIDWTDERFKTNINEYLSYLANSIKLLCTNYGEIGGFWFDGSWFKQKIDWNFDELFSIIRTYQKNAIICNNGGLESLGEITHKDIDCQVFERSFVETSPAVLEKVEIAKELCQTINDHWGYFAGDNNYKSIAFLFNEYKICQKSGCNYLLNVGPQKDGSVFQKEKDIFFQLGEKIKNYENNFC